MPARRSRGPRADWVYRPNVHDAAGALVDDFGTYEPTVKVLLPGDPAAIAAVLYDSHNYINPSTQAGNVPRPVPSSGRAEASRALIKAVQGTVIFRPSTWALGSVWRLGMRFGIFEQDPNSGAFLIDPLYAMWSLPTLNNVKPAVWANDRKWQHERRSALTFSDNSQIWVWNFRFRVNRRLNPNECYGIYTATQSDSVNLIMQMFFRTLVSDEG